MVFPMLSQDEWYLSTVEYTDLVSGFYIITSQAHIAWFEMKNPREWIAILTRLFNRKDSSVSSLVVTGQGAVKPRRRRRLIIPMSAINVCRAASCVVPDAWYIFPSFVNAHKYHCYTIFVLNITPKSGPSSKTLSNVQPRTNSIWRSSLGWTKGG